MTAETKKNFFVFLVKTITETKLTQAWIRQFCIDYIALYLSIFFISSSVMLLVGVEKKVFVIILLKSIAVALSNTFIARFFEIRKAFYREKIAYRKATAPKDVPFWRRLGMALLYAVTTIAYSDLFIVYFFTDNIRFVYEVFAAYLIISTFIGLNVEKYLEFCESIAKAIISRVMKKNGGCGFSCHLFCNNVSVHGSFSKR